MHFIQQLWAIAPNQLGFLQWPMGMSSGSFKQTPGTRAGLPPCPLLSSLLTLWLSEKPEVSRPSWQLLFLQKHLWFLPFLLHTASCPNLGWYQAPSKKCSLPKSNLQCSHKENHCITEGNYVITQKLTSSSHNSTNWTGVLGFWKLHPNKMVWFCFFKNDKSSVFSLSVSRDACQARLQCSVAQYITGQKKG